MPAFESSYAVLSFGSLMPLLNQVLPPLSRWDEAKLCVISPLLASILSSSEDIEGLLKEIPPKVLETTVRQLAEFAISSQHEKHSRASAASCLFSIFLHSDSDSLSIPQIMSESLYNSLIESIKILQSGEKNLTVFTNLEDIFNLIGHWVRQVAGSLLFLY